MHMQNEASFLLSLRKSEVLLYRASLIPGEQQSALMLDVLLCYSLCCSCCLPKPQCLLVCNTLLLCFSYTQYISFILGTCAHVR